MPSNQRPAAAKKPLRKNRSAARSGSMTRSGAPRHRIQVQIGARYAALVRQDQLRQAARAALAVQGVTEARALSIVITGAAQLRRLNRQFRGIDAPTDVLSFNADDEPGYLGDVIISFPTARTQARSGGHPVAAELQLLVVHGVLHLLGHDHAGRAEQATMWRAQAAALRSIRAAITAPAD